MNPLEQLRQNEDGTITVTIRNPYEEPRGEGGKELSTKARELLCAGEVDEVKIGKIYARHLMAVDGKDENTRAALLIEMLSGCPMQAIRRMSVSDFEACSLAVAAQMGKFQLSGPGS